MTKLLFVGLFIDAIVKQVNMCKLVLSVCIQNLPWDFVDKLYTILQLNATI
ncbi:hypothetical protein SAMN02746098_01088 [Desulfosporosinus lacus DSM 15449]|uniref:Uncharacterized protein n=1 Tax=Desulfosporosinus lacus DSM 15449 TaxID=1121420 RepID=A0A1M5UV90_9FIRM|nr:hypothetical protein SAMN02746098_01088 [Desulfosporosinus lacus DSM 15449]